MADKDYEKFERQTKEKAHEKAFKARVKFDDLFAGLQKQYGSFGTKPRVEQYHNGARIYTDFDPDSRDAKSDYKDAFKGLLPKVLERVQKAFKGATGKIWFEGSYQNMEFEFDLPDTATGICEIVAVSHIVTATLAKCAERDAKPGRPWCIYKHDHPRDKQPKGWPKTYETESKGKDALKMMHVFGELNIDIQDGKVNLSQLEVALAADYIGGKEHYKGYYITEVRYQTDEAMFSEVVGFEARIAGVDQAIAKSKSKKKLKKWIEENPPGKVREAMKKGKLEVAEAAEKKLELPTELKSMGFKLHYEGEQYQNAYILELDRYRRHDHGGGENGDDWLPDHKIDEDFEEGAKTYKHKRDQANKILKEKGFVPDAEFELGEKGHFSLEIYLKKAEKPKKAKAEIVQAAPLEQVLKSLDAMAKKYHGKMEGPAAGGHIFNFPEQDEAIDFMETVHRLPDVEKVAMRTSHGGPGMGNEHFVRVAIRNRASAGYVGGELHCDMKKECSKPVAYLDEKGFAYCEEHGKQRQGSVRCRKLSPTELEKLKNKQPLKEF